MKDKGACPFFQLQPHWIEMPATESHIDSPSTGRLVIRIKLIPQEPPPATRWLPSKSALVMLAVVAIGLLSWLGISTFGTDPPPPPAAVARVAPPAPVSAPEPAPEPVPAPPSSINEVIPDVPRSALDTIRGTIRVSVRVTVAKQGSVVDATAEDRGPSRYFERLAVQASKQWKFTPAQSDEQRSMLVRFNFTRAGVTASANP